MSKCVKLHQTAVVGVNVQVRLPAELVENLKQQASQKGLSLSGLVRMLLFEHLHEGDKVV